MDKKKLRNVLGSLIEKEYVVFNKNWSEKYPNLQAVLMGTVSHPVNDWPGVRGELKKLLKEFDQVIKELHELKKPLEEGLDCTVCGRAHLNE